MIRIVLVFFICTFLLVQPSLSSRKKSRKSTQSYNAALKRQRNGDLNGAIVKYREAIEFADGFHPRASWSLGYIYQYKQDAGLAIEVLQQALDALHHHRINKKRRGKKKIPSSVRVVNGLSTGNSYSEDVSYECGLQFYLGNLKSMQTQHIYREAQDHYLSVTKLCPDFPDAHFRLAGLTTDLSLSIFRFQKAIELRPEFLEAYVNLGAVFKDVGMLDESVKAYDEAVRLSPNSAEALANRGVSLQAAGRLREAIESYRKARDLRPDMALMHLNLAQSVDELGEDNPIASYREALRLDPSLTKAYCGLFNSLMYRLEWKDRDTMLRDLQPDHGEIMDCVRSFYAATFSLDPLQSLSVARREAREAREKSLLQQKSSSCWKHYDLNNNTTQNKPLRVTFASSDFGAHTVGNLVHRLFERYDTSRLLLRGVALSPDDGTLFRSNVRNAMNGGFETQAASSSDREVFNALTRDRSDLVIDLNGFSRGERSSAMSSVSLTATYLGFPSSTGGLHDVSITDTVSTPVEISNRLYDESLLLFASSSYMISSHVDTYPLQDENLFHFSDEFIKSREHRDSIDRILQLKRQGRLILCNFGQLYKITPKIISAWADIMKSLPNSILWMVRHKSMNDRSVINLRLELAMRGIDSKRRVVVSPLFDLAHHMQIKRLADLSLDTFPYVKFNRL